MHVCIVDAGHDEAAAGIEGWYAFCLRCSFDLVIASHCCEDSITGNNECLGGGLAVVDCIHISVDVGYRICSTGKRVRFAHVCCNDVSTCELVDSGRIYFLAVLIASNVEMSHLNLKVIGNVRKLGIVPCVWLSGRCIGTLRKNGFAASSKIVRQRVNKDFFNAPPVRQQEAS